MNKRNFLFSVLMLLVAVGSLNPAAAQEAEEAPEYVVPVPAGWTRIDEETRYGRDNLWEYINGAAELFLTYRFRQLTVADFEQGDRALSVSVYDMSRPLDAYGVYESEKPAEGDQMPGVGAAAVLQPPYRGLLLKGRWYVKVEAGGGDVTGEHLSAAMKDIAAGLEGSNELPAQLASLPQTGRVPGSVAFTGAGFLGFSDLNACLHADYKTEAGVAYRLFVMKPGAALLRNETGRWQQGKDGVRLVFERKIPYSGVVVLLGDEEQMIGVSGFDQAGPALELLKNLDR